MNTYLSQIASRPGIASDNPPAGSLMPATRPVIRPESAGPVGLSGVDEATDPPAFPAVYPTGSDGGSREPILPAAARLVPPQMAGNPDSAPSYLQRHTDRLASGDSHVGQPTQEQRYVRQDKITAEQTARDPEIRSPTLPATVRPPNDSFESSLPIATRPPESLKSRPIAQRELFPDNAPTEQPAPEIPHFYIRTPASVDGKPASDNYPATQRPEKATTDPSSVGRLMPVSPPIAPQRTSKDTSAARLVIGRISVEVVQPAAPAVQTKPAARPHPSGTSSPKPATGDTYKLSFGLGQL